MRGGLLTTDVPCGPLIRPTGTSLGETRGSPRLVPAGG